MPQSRRPSRFSAAVVTISLAACATGDVPRDAGGPNDAAPFGSRFPPLPAGIVADVRARPPDAAVAVLHVEQTHFPAGLTGDGAPDDPASRDAMRERILRANDSQRAVHGTLRRLAAAGWDRVFAEGVAVEFPQTDRLSLAMEVLGALRRIDEVLGTPPPTFAERFIAHGPAGPPDDPAWEEVRYAPGAEVLLALSGEIRLLPAERRDLLRAADGALRDGGAAAAHEWSESREDAILAEVAGRGDGPAVVLLGAAHDLADNVARWNRSNPRRPFALAVVRPL